MNKMVLESLLLTHQIPCRSFDHHFIWH